MQGRRITQTIPGEKNWHSAHTMNRSHLQELEQVALDGLADRVNREVIEVVPEGVLYFAASNIKKRHPMQCESN